MTDDYQSGETGRGVSMGTINPPDLSVALKPKANAIKDAGQARSIIVTLEQANRERSLKNARIMAKANSERPYAQGALEAEGLGWKSNFSSQILSMLISKVAPRFCRAVDGVKFLTNSKLPDDAPGASMKTEAFRREISTLVRGRAGWGNFIAEVSQESALFGYTGVAWLDEFSWWPQHFRQNEFMVPTGTKQNAADAQVVVLQETFLVHELFSLIADKEVAQTAGWNLKNTVTRLNAAVPENRRSNAFGWERIFEDLIRENSVGMSHEAGALVVKVSHLLATEISGEVSHYIVAEESSPPEKGDEIEGRDFLFERENQFKSMADAVAFFAFEFGNGKLQGSKGIGRQTYSIAAMLDRSRNEVVDRMNLSGKLVVQCDPKAARRFKMSVVGNVVLIDQGYQISERKIESGVEEFMAMDEFLTRLLDQIAGATTPKAFEGDRVTKAAVDLFASREEESRDNIISRFLNQFAVMMTTLQKRACNADVADKDAKAMQKRLLEIMTRKELNQLADSPVAETVEDYTNIERQQIALIAQEGRGNPLYDQRKLEQLKLTAQISEEFANQVLLPEEDPTVTAEQTRMQQMELLILAGQGAEVPVSPRDNHLIHLQVLHPAMEAAAAETVTAGADGLQILHVLFKHAQEHFQFAEQQGIPNAELAPVKDFLSKLETAIAELDKGEVENQKNAEAAPVPVPQSIGGSAAPPGGPPVGSGNAP